MAGGRPSKMTPDTVKKLEEAFLLGCSDLEACFYADITKPTLYDYCEKHPGFSDRKEALKKNPVFVARKKMIDLMESKDEQISSRASIDTLNRYDGKPKERVEMTGKDGGPMQTITKEMDPVEAAKAYASIVKKE